ncbi:MAG: ABC transporter ATP-binding protein [Hyphomicrobiaceae bacterium]|nr:ABC transporter ATP-binding protein [Hyphomicrobiaceae bacterium]
MLRVAGLSSAYGRVHALRGVTLEVESGEIVALLGSNGAGKTTLLRAISGVQPIKGGQVHFEGAAIERERPHRRVARGLIQVPEGRQVFAPLSVEDNLRLGAYRRRVVNGIEPLERVYSIFPVLREKRHSPAASLSGGQQQMLAVGRAMMAGPRLLLLDEPSMGLAPIIVEQIFSVLVELNKQGVTILLVEQNANAALQIATRAYVLETGEITLSGTGRELLGDDRVRAAYLGL